MKGFYVLKTNGDLVYKKKAPEDDSVVKVWSFDSSSEEDRWTIILEALTLGAKKKKLVHLVQKWELTSFALIKRWYFRMQNGHVITFKESERIGSLVRELLSVDYHLFWWAFTEVFHMSELYRCPGPEKEPGVFSGCTGNIDCPVCRGTGVLFRCPICFLPLHNDGTCLDKHNFPLEKIDEGGK